MSEAINKVQKNETLFTGLGTSMGFSAAITGGFGSLSAIKRNKGIGKAIKQTKLQNGVIKEFLEKNNAVADGFTKSYAVAKNYEKYSSAIKSVNKAEKALAKMKNGKPTFLQRLFNLGKSEAEVVEKYTNKRNLAKDALDNFEKKLKNGEEILEEIKDGKKIGSNVLGNSLKGNTGALFKEELLNPLNLFYAVTSTVSRVKKDALPVFKEKGFLEGIKATGVAIGKSVADVVSNAGFSAGFRILGSRIGMLIAPLGLKATAAAVGGTIGDIFGTFLSNKIIIKAFGEDKPKEDTNTPTAQNNSQTNATEEQAGNQLPETLQNSQTAQYAETQETQAMEQQTPAMSKKELMEYADSVIAEANKHKISARKLYA